MPKRKILHAADIHLDSPLQKLDRYENAPADQIRKATRRALENLTSLAIEQAVDMVVIAGDLYDGDWNDQNTGLAFVKQAARLVQANIPLLVIRGNHDAANLMTSSLPLPRNPDGSEIFLSHEQPESRFFDDLGIVVHGMSFRSRAEKRNLASKYPDSVSGFFNLGLLHTGLEGESIHGNYAPCTARQLTDMGYDYWALGHIHIRQNLAIGDGAPIVFSGNIQGRHIREQGAKGCVIVDVDDKNQCSHNFNPLDVLRWEEFRVDVASFTHRDEVSDAYQHWLTEQIEQAEGRLVIARVRLVGASGIHNHLHQHEMDLRSDLQAISVSYGAGQAWLEDVKIRTSPPQGSSLAIDTEGPLQSLHEVMVGLRNDDDLAATIRTELEDLHKKLPKELRSGVGEETLPFSDPQWLSEIVEAAAATVSGKLHGESSSVGDGRMELDDEFRLEAE